VTGALPSVHGVFDDDFDEFIEVNVVPFRQSREVGPVGGKPCDRINLQTRFGELLHSSGVTFLPQ